MIQRLTGHLRGVARAAAWVSNFFAVVALLSVVAILVYEIFARFLFNRPTGWSDEMTAYLMPSIVFLAAGHTLLQGGHIRIDMLYRRLGSLSRAWVRLLNESVGLAGLLLVAWFAIVMLERVHRSESVATAGTITFPEYLPRIVVPLGLGVMVLAQLVIWLQSLLVVLGNEDQEVDGEQDLSSDAPTHQGSG